MANKGKFINTTRSDSIDALVTTAKSLINNPYYVHGNKIPTLVEYFNINKERSTLDEGFKGISEDIGKDSPLWYNIIKNLYMYGLSQIQIQMEHGEFGVESGEVAGEAFILPNTIIPYPGDLFCIGYIKEKFMFRVTGVSHDTLENGSNFYKLTYKLESQRDHHKELNIADTYEMLSNNVGTGFNTIIRDTKYNLIKELEKTLFNLKVYYKSVFYSDRVQSFIFKLMEERFYDPFMTQFLMNNSLLTGGDEYIYITQQIPLNNVFPLDYDRSFFKCLENQDFKNIRKYTYKGIGKLIDSQVSIFATRVEDYLQVDMRYSLPEGQLYGILQCFMEELIEGIENNILYEDEKSIYNIIIKFANGIDISDSDLDFLDFDIHNNITLFYAIPCIIFCLESSIKQMMIKSDEQ